MIRKPLHPFYIQLREYKGRIILHKFGYMKLVILCSIIIGAIGLLIYPHTIKAALNLQTEAAKKEYSGIHLGNKAREAGSNWSDDELRLIDPSLGASHWPDSVVILSNQVYKIIRDSNNGCRITGAQLRTIDADQTPTHIVQYLQRASEAGVKIIIRINPSPGSFKDWAEEDESSGYRMNHELEIPGSFNINEEHDLCDEGHIEKYRPAVDIADEIRAIHVLNRSADVKIDEYGFEPANEPNTEWYDFGGNRPRNVSITWEEMNKYFKTVADRVAALNSIEGLDAKVFTPPMSQDAFAERIQWEVCEIATLFQRGYFGYTVMMPTINASYGFSWHNYWHMGREEYGECRPRNRVGHISFYFPDELKGLIKGANKPTIITEADLLSVHQRGNIDDKRDNDLAVSESIRHFFHEEYEKGGSDAHYGTKPTIAFWLLNDNTCTEEKCPSDENCPPGVENCRLDHNWHEAYGDDFPDDPDVSFAKGQWFEKWYIGPERYPHMGDVNCDGKADSIDVLFVLRYDVALISSNGSETCEAYLDKPPSQRNRIFLKTCDVTDDGNCYAVDALIILRCEVGLKSKFCPAIEE